MPIPIHLRGVEEDRHRTTNFFYQIDPSKVPSTKRTAEHLEEMRQGTGPKQATTRIFLQVLQKHAALFEGLSLQEDEHGCSGEELLHHQVDMFVMPVNKRVI